MSIVETRQESSAERAEESTVSTARARGSRRRRLSQGEEQAIAQLYADSTTPRAEIRERFGLSESTLYRVVQRHGVALRGHTGSPTRSKGPGAIAPTSRRSSSPAGATLANSQSPTSAGTTSLPVRARAGKAPTRARAGRATAKLAIASRAGPPLARNGGRTQQQFRVEFQAERVFEATDIRGALRQAESLGAVEIIAVTRQN